MKWFAPVNIGIGVHWHHFGQPILPPIIETDHYIGREENRTLVYLPFERSQDVLNVLSHFNHRFIFHCSDIKPGEYNNVLVRGFSREGFKDSLHTTNGVICNAGFELASEALNLGRKIMVKPLKGQMEQSSNALALTELGLGLSTASIDVKSIARFLDHATHQQIKYSNVPDLIAQWMLNYPHQSIDSLVASAWEGVSLPEFGARKQRKRQTKLVLAS